MVGTARHVGAAWAMLAGLAGAVLVLSAPATAGVVDNEFVCAAGACVGVLDYRQSYGPGCNYVEATGVLVISGGTILSAQGRTQCAGGDDPAASKKDTVRVALSTPLSSTSVEWTATHQGGGEPLVCYTVLRHSGPATGTTAMGPGQASGGQLDDCPAGPPPDIAGDNI